MIWLYLLVHRVVHSSLVCKLVPISSFPFLVFYCRELHPSQSVWEKCTFSVSFLRSTLVVFLFSVVVCLLVSVLSFCLSVLGLFFFFHIPNACLKILNCIWRVVLPFSSALCLFKRRGRDSLAEMLLFSVF